MSQIDLYCGDCFDIMDKIDDNTIDTIIFSPPYNKKGFTKVLKTSGKSHTWNNYSIDYTYYNDNMERDTYISWQIDVLEKCLQKLKENGSIFYNHKNIRANNKIVFHPYEIIRGLKSGYLYQEIIWNRKNSPNIRNDLLLPTTEKIFWIVKSKPKVYKQNLDKKFNSEVWDINPKINKLHPATYPEQLCENCILLTTNENDVVLDPFMGIGTTGIACKKLNRNFIGNDLDENYFNIAVERLFKEM